MRYTLFLYNNEADFKETTPEEMQQAMQVFGQYIQALKEADVFVDTDWLQPSMSATKISLRDGELFVQDGPYADTKEQLGGFFVIDVANLDAAMAWAQKCPTIHYGIIEIRPSAMPTGG